MKVKKETRESKIINILGSSINIELQIKNTYTKIYAQVKKHPYVREEQMPIFVSFLYDLIINLGELPSNVYFADKYMSTYFEDVQSNSLLYFAYQDRVNQAYDSLVRDLHFYFKLVEKKAFSDVQLSYAYDIEAKQDVVVTLNGKKLGLQLFKGDDNQIPLKKKQAERRKVFMGYPDFYLPLNGSNTKPINIGTESNPFYAYSDHDADLVYKALTSIPIESKDNEEERYVFPTVKKNVQDTTRKDLNDKNLQLTTFEALHSFVYVGEKSINHQTQLIEMLVENGVRIEWISPSEGSNSKFKANKHVRTHTWADAHKHNLMIVDGKYSGDQNGILKKAGEETTFNYEQYIVEHASMDEHLIVEAGAGSGKTETLISRIIFLLHTHKIYSLEEVVMMTFTNEAADNMKAKLSKRLYALYENTKNLRYINWCEQITSMRIMTIPAFSKTLLQDFSTELGMSRNFAVRSLSEDRKEIIAEILDEYISENDLKYSELDNLREFEIVGMIDDYWTQLEKKGIVSVNYKDIQWGESSSEKTERIYQDLIKAVLKKCEDRFTQLKVEKDVFTVNDLTQKISNIKSHLNYRQLSFPFKFLFVDEFQDTDDVQIELVYTLAKLTGSQLFVVGDIKQSIYRFRGANYTAFNLLIEWLGKDKIRRYNLVKNYRTTLHILTPLEKMFDVWRKNPRKILPSGESKNIDERLKPTVKKKKYDKPYDLVTEKKSIETLINNLYLSLKQDTEHIKENKPVELAILVRTNYQVKKIRDALDELRKQDRNLIYDIVTGGSLFSSEAARDLLILLNALCYERDPVSFFALHQTAFSKESFNPFPLIDFNGNKDKLLASISFDAVEGFQEAKDDLRLKPVLHVIYRFLTNNSYESVLNALNMQEHEIRKYRLNLYRILEIASESIDSSMLNMFHLRNWLELQIATNRNEDEIDVEVTNCEKLIKVMTIHKAKGLEFDTVLVPFTKKSLTKNSKQNMIVLKERGKMEVGWKKGEHESTNYKKLKHGEDIESIREEARLLYVALTRAKNRLVVNYVKSKNHNTLNWYELIRLGKEEQ